MKKYYTFLFVLFSVLMQSQSFQLVKDENPSDSGLNMNCSFREMNGKLYYLFSGESTLGNIALYTSDGTSAGTYRISPSNVSISGNIIISGNKLYFFATDGINGKEPWVSDGTLAGTQLLKNIHPTTVDNNFDTSSVRFLSADATKAFFIANDGTTGNELWVTDGTTAGTNLVLDIFQGTNASQIQVAPSAIGNNMKDGKLYFFASNGSGSSTINGIEPWVSDGTLSGTFMLKDINTSSNNGSTGTAYSKHFIEYNGKMYFYAIGSTAASYAIYETDGTTTGTSLFKSLDRVDEFIVKDNLLYFTCVNGPSVWTSDGTLSGTTQIATIPNGQLNNVATCQMTIANNELFFRVISNSVGSELFKLNSSNQLNNVKDIWSGTSNGVNSNIFQDRKILQVYDNKVWFLGTDGSSSGAMQVWNSDGTDTGTIPLTPLVGGGWAGGNGNNYNLFTTSFGVFMIYVHPTTGGELYFYSNGSLNNNDFTNNSDFVVYPNPSNGEFTIITTQEMIGAKTEIYNLMGQKIKSFELNGIETIQNLNHGFYIIEFKKDGKKTTKKIMIK
jgi:ELWxxDGT repeat protein